MARYELCDYLPAHVEPPVCNGHLSAGSQVSGLACDAVDPRGQPFVC